MERTGWNKIWHDFFRQERPARPEEPFINLCCSGRRVGGLKGRGKRVSFAFNPASDSGISADAPTKLSRWEMAVVHKMESQLSTEDPSQHQEEERAHEIERSPACSALTEWWIQEAEEADIDLLGVESMPASHASIDSWIEEGTFAMDDSAVKERDWLKNVQEQAAKQETAATQKVMLQETSEEDELAVMTHETTRLDGDHSTRAAGSEASSVDASLQCELLPVSPMRTAGIGQGVVSVTDRLVRIRSERGLWDAVAVVGGTPSIAAASPADRPKSAPSCSPVSIRSPGAVLAADPLTIDCCSSASSAASSSTREAFTPTGTGPPSADRQADHVILHVEPMSSQLPLPFLAADGASTGHVLDSPHYDRQRKWLIKSLEAMSTPLDHSTGADRQSAQPSTTHWLLSSSSLKADSGEDLALDEMSAGTSSSGTRKRWSWTRLPWPRTLARSRSGSHLLTRGTAEGIRTSSQPPGDLKKRASFPRGAHRQMSRQMSFPCAAHRQPSTPVRRTDSFEMRV